MAAPIAFRRYRAPADDGAALIDPPWERQFAQLAKGRPLPAISLGGRPLEAVAAQARVQLVAAAGGRTSEYADVAPSASPGPLVVSGHQPELFHPGVWVKNFALDALAKGCGGVGVHLIVDSDLCRTPSIRVPTGSAVAPRLEAIPFDAPSPSMPFEERRVVDPDLFASFARRVADAVNPFVAAPLAAEIWEDAVAAARRSGLLRDALSWPRHALERRGGSATLELPLSEVLDGEAFRRLAAELLLRTDDTRRAYNAALAEYRVAHRLRSPAQPLPDLAREGEWTESPLWVWSSSDPTRRPLFVRHAAGQTELTDRARWRSAGPAEADGLVAWLAELRQRGVKLRSRALVTTLYCRLVLADLFLHGIGGAKYDQVTDRFAERLLGVALPPHATLSATLRLPIERPSVGPSDRIAALRKLRDLRYRPEAFAAADHPAAVEKRLWVETLKTPQNAAERHAAISAANEALSGDLAAEREAATVELGRVEAALRTAALLGSREFAFCLYPAEVRQRLARLVGKGGREP